MEFSLDRLYRINRRVIIWAIFFGLLYLLRDFFTLIFLTFLFSFFVYPATRFLIERLRIQRVVAVTGAYLVIVAAYFALLWWIAPNLVSEVGGVHKNLPELQTKLTELRNDVAERFPDTAGLLDTYLPADEIGRAIDRVDEQLGARLPEFARTVLGMGITVLLAILFSYLILIDISRLGLELKRLKASRLHDFYEQTAQPLVRFAYVVGQAFRAQAVIACANTVLTIAGLVVMGIPSIVMLSIIVFICSFIPALGVFISTTPIVLVALNSSGVGMAIAAVIFVCVIHAIEAYVLNPLIYGKHLKLNPVLVLIILFIGHHAFGIWGMLLGVPVAFYLLHDVFKIPILSDRLGTASLASLPRGEPAPKDLTHVEGLGARIEPLRKAADR